MNKTTEALKLAEEALETAFNLLCFPVDSIAEMYCFGMGDCDEARQETKEALAAIREALAEQEKQEPEWYYGVDSHGCTHFYHRGEVRPTEYSTPLYAAPVSVEAEWIETNKALVKEIIEQRNQYLDNLAEAIDLSVKAEREACAKVCDELVLNHPGRADKTSDQCAAAIRARSEK